MLDWPGQQILVVVASIHMKHSEGRSGGGFLNNSSCLGVSRNLSVRGNLLGSLSSRSKQLFTIARDATEKQVNILAPIERSGGRPLSISETSDVVGMRKGDFPSLLRVQLCSGKSESFRDPGMPQPKYTSIFGVDYAISLLP